MTKYSATEVSRHFRDVVKQVLTSREPAIVTSGRKETVAIVPATWIRIRWTGFNVEHTHGDQGGEQ